MWIGVDMMMQGQGTVKTSWQAVDEWCICLRIVAMWSGSIREGFRGYVSNLGIECTVTVVATPPPPPPFNSPKATYGGLWGLCTCRFKVGGTRLKQPGTKR